MKRILIVTTRPVDKITGGDVLRIVNIAKYLSSYFDVEIICLKSGWFRGARAVKSVSFTYIKHSYWQIIKNLFYALLKRDSLQKHFYYNNQLINYVDKQAAEFDKVVLHLSRLHFLKPILDRRNIHTIMELTDALSLMYEDSVRLGKYLSLKSLLYNYEHLFYPKHQLEICQSYPSVVVCGQRDKDELTKFSRNIHCLGNGVDIPKLESAQSRISNSIIFIGNLRTLQNQEGIKNFYDNCFRGQLDLLGLRLKIIGYCPKNIQKYFQGKIGVETLGFVDNLEPLMMDAFCGVNPVEIGAGIQNKSLLIGAYALPVISINKSLDRFEANDYFIGCSNFETMATKILELYRDQEFAQRLGDDTKRFIENNYAWDRALKGYEDV